jgi:hypothetical protein
MKAALMTLNEIRSLDADQPVNFRQAKLYIRALVRYLPSGRLRELLAAARSDPSGRFSFEDHFFPATEKQRRQLHAAYWHLSDNSDDRSYESADDPSSRRVLASILSAQLRIRDRACQ